MRKMRTSLKTGVLLLLLIAFLVSSGMPAFNSKWLAHELDHDRQALVLSVDHEHVLQLDDDDKSAAKLLGDTEHQSLHLAGHLQPPLGSSFHVTLGDPPVRQAPLLSRLIALLSIELAPPFRPPRSVSLI